MRKIKTIIFLSILSTTCLYGQKKISIEGSFGSGLRMLEHSFDESSFVNYTDKFLFNEVLLSVNIYSRNNLNRLSFSIGHSLQHLTMRRELNTGEFKGGEFKDKGLFYFASTGMGYRRYFSKNIRSRFYCEGRFSVGYPYGLTINSETTLDGVVVSQERIPFESHPASSHFLSLQYKGDLGFGYSFTLNSSKSINRNLLVLNTYIGAFHSNSFFRESQMLGGTLNIGLEYRFRSR